MPSSIIKQIRKRNGTFVLFDQDKITTAVRKAFFAETNDSHDADAVSITEQVVADLEARGLHSESEFVPSVEEIQDLVEIGIMERGFFDVAKAYIIYRVEHARTRQQEKEEVKEKIEKSELIVVKRNGERELFSIAKLRKALLRAVRGYEDVVDVDAILEQARSEVYDGISTRDVAHALVLAARSFIERDPAYSHVASRLLLETVIYKDAIGYEEGDRDFVAQYREAFVKNIERGVSIGLLDERMLNFDLKQVATMLKPERDDLFRYLGVETFADRYLLKDRRDSKKHILLEAPQMLWMRIAMGLSLLEDDKEKRAITFYDLISSMRYVPATPTLMNAGTIHSQLSSCYLGVVDDSLESIFKAYSDYAYLAKFDGGVGQSWTKLRGTNARIKSTNIVSNGTVPFLKILDSTVTCINRSGRRRGACSVYLETWHIDIEDFLLLTKNTGDERRRTPDIHPVNWIPDLFMKRVRDDGEWTLFSPDEVSDLPELYGSAFERRYKEYEAMAARGEIQLFKTVRAKDLWKKMLIQLYETGHPWINFKDPTNVRSPQDHVGVIHNSNLCTEITLNTIPDEEVAVCNLGSINLARHMKGEALDEELLSDTVTTAMRMLDNVIDINFYPIPETKTANMRHRPVGLGVMGLQDTLFIQGLAFDSDRAVEFGDYVQEFVSYHAILASSELARERGTYQTYVGSKWDRGLLPVDTIELLEKERGEPVQVDRTVRMDWKRVRDAIRQFGMRNSNCMAVAPTATISNIAGCFPTVEPIYKNIYVKSNISGSFIVTNHYLIADLKKEGLWNTEMLELIKGQEGSIQNISSIPQWIKDKHKEVFEIKPEWIIKAAAHRARWIDQSQSINIFYAGTSGKEISDFYTYAWKTGLKTTYYLRTLGASGIEHSTVSLEKQKGLDKKKEAVEEVARVKEEVVSSVGMTNMSSPSVDEKQQTLVTTVPVSEDSPKLCKLDDPECESCQ